jgi:hypothetical protein
MLNAEIRPKILSMSAATIERLHLRRFPASPARRRGYSTTTERRNPIGFVHGSYAATLLDTVMGCAVHSRMMIGQAYRRCLPPRGGRNQVKNFVAKVGVMIKVSILYPNKPGLHFDMSYYL